MAIDFTPISCGETPNPRRYVDDARNLGVAMGLAKAVSRGRGPVFAFGFGFPGTGKSTFAKALSARVCKTLSFESHLEVDCLQIARLEIPDAQHELDGLWNSLASAPRPLLLFLDEIDTIAREREKYVAERIVTEWTMTLLKTFWSAQVSCLLIGMTNYIDDCDKVVKGHFGPRIYFPPPSANTLRAILRSHGLSAAKSRATINRYMTLCGGDRKRPVHRSLDVGISVLNQARGDAWKGMSNEELAYGFFNNCVLPTTAEVAEYEKKYEGHRKAAENLRDLFAGGSLAGPPRRQSRTGGSQ